MSLQFSNPECGHMETDDAPCNCYVRRHGIPLKTQTSRELQPISTAMTVDEACAEKWRQGQIKYGPVFVGDPLEELYAECIDSLNYYEELERQRGLLSPNLVACRVATRHIAELVRTEARR